MIKRKVVKVPEEIKGSCSGCVYNHPSIICSKANDCYHEHIIYKYADTLQNKDWYVFIPENNYGIKQKSYHTNEIVNMLREYKENPEMVSFIADMLEV